MHDYIGIEHEEGDTKYPRCTSMRIPGVPVFIHYHNEEYEWHDTILEYEVEENIVRRVDDAPAWEVGINSNTSRLRKEP